MDAGQLSEAIKRISINWNLPTSGPPFLDRCKLAWDFLSDLDIDSVNKAIQQIITMDQQYPPRIGQIRRLTIDLQLGDDAIPNPAQAWAQFRTAIDSAESGTPFAKPHDLVGETMKSFPNNGAGLRTNADRELFLSAYNKKVFSAERERYASGENS